MDVMRTSLKGLDENEFRGPIIQKMLIRVLSILSSNKYFTSNIDYVQGLSDSMKGNN